LKRRREQLAGLLQAQGQRQRLAAGGAAALQHVGDGSAMVSVEAVAAAAAAAAVTRVCRWLGQQ
jgi:hypothetical protein